MKYRIVSAAAYIAFFALIFLLPLFLNGFWVNRVAIYLVYSICAVAISMSWGYAGVLNLGQGLFFGIGAYMLAMSLTLALPENNPVPELMLLNMEPDAVRDLCCVTPGSFLWIPFRSLAVGMIAAIVVPIVLAAALGFVMFKRRTAGVYVSIITLAFALIGQLLIINNQPLTGGFNGLANLALLDIAGLEFDPYGPSVYYLVAVTLLVVILIARYLLSGRIGQILKAIREDEARARYLGYDVENYKLFIFCLSAGVAGLAGMLFTVTAEFASPSLMATSFSISMVIWAATGGRASLLGAAIGALIVNFVGSLASESAAFQPVWPIILGGLFIFVVLVMPNGLAGICKGLIERWRKRDAAREEAYP
ncbi:urea ABC transporter permease subunit UrtC [Taklimakanibacter albus]|uniref:Urea ABC transporter permease subunit UrtC n=1 Tax=Taklimakanibacter albus TaxID=2800327 RepID=A0ACC5R309_9HYPH|nr:urea ABC transporter permease subunit UrtC [Aestuariivirga sp. YIM B02566]MBK1867046.1 urea ABC transporter permease subunit UrtC [Aestuariivirga sp. YIM B02566]